MGDTQGEAKNLLRIALIFFSLPLVVVVGLFVVLSLLGHGGRTDFERGFDRVRVGMTVEEVRAILGPESKEGVPPPVLRAVDGGRHPTAEADRLAVWERDRRTIGVWFARGRVVFWALE